MERRPDALEDAAGVPRLRGEMLRDELSRAIQDGRLAPGERLDEVRIARHFGVSRTPVREALRQLAAVHLVEIRPHKGAVVAGADRTNHAAMIEAATEVAVACARLAASRRTTAGMALLRERYAAWRRSLDTEDDERRRSTRADLEAAVIAAAGNETLAEIAVGLRRRLPRADPVRPVADAAVTALIAAIAGGEAAAAEDATRRWFAATVAARPTPPLQD